MRLRGFGWKLKVLDTQRNESLCAMKQTGPKVTTEQARSIGDHFLLFFHRGLRNVTIYAK